MWNTPRTRCVVLLLHHHSAAPSCAHPLVDWWVWTHFIDRKREWVGSGWVREWEKSGENHQQIHSYVHIVCRYSFRFFMQLENVKITKNLPMLAFSVMVGCTWGALAEIFHSHFSLQDFPICSTFPPLFYSLHSNSSRSKKCSQVSSSSRVELGEMKAIKIPASVNICTSFLFTFLIVFNNSIRCWKLQICRM